MYVSQILYTLNLYRAVCQLHLNKTGREKKAAIANDIKKKKLMTAEMKLGAMSTLSWKLNSGILGFNTLLP